MQSFEKSDNNEEIKKLISKLLSEDNTLSDIQKILDKEYDQKMTFLDLRMLAAELEDVDWSKNEEPEESEKHEETLEEDISEGKTVVEVSKLTRPGIALSGNVKFASGASAAWVLDQNGRLGFEKSEGEPTEDDLKEFQEELKKSLGAG